MQTVTKTKYEWQRDENGCQRMVAIPYEKFIFDENDKMQIVSEYYHSNEPAQNVVERYKLSSKQVLFNWMDKYLHEESLSLPDNQSIDPMAKQSPEDRIKELEKENKRLEKALELEKLRAKAFDTMISVAEDTFNIPIRKKSGTKR